MSLDAMAAGHNRATSNFCHLDRSELDDLLDEILGDQLFVSNFASQGKEEAPGINGKQRGNTEVHAGHGMMTQQYNNHTSAADGAVTTTSSAPKNQVVMQTSVTFNQRNDPGRGGMPNPPIANMYEQESRESRVLPGGRNRAPSLPVNYSDLEHRRRLQSVPCSDYYGQAPNSQNYYTAESDRFVRGMCSEEPITWLDQQKMKLRTRQETKGWMGQSTQQKQLMEELKAVQLKCAEKRVERELLNSTVEQYAEHTNSHLTQAQSPTGQGLVCQVYVGNGDLRAEKSASSSLSLQSEKTSASNGESKDMCKSERSYYVSGIERPPFTTHQTKYVFSVSSPHVSGGHPGSMSPTLQLLQKVSTKCSPPTPLRGESSREAMKHDWDLEQWEQGSHTSLSSRSDATERSVVVFPNAGKGMDVGMWNVENHAQHNIPASAAIERDGLWSVGTSHGTVVGATALVSWPAPNGDFRPSGTPAPVNWPAPNGDLRPTVTTAPVNRLVPNGDLRQTGAPAPVNWPAPNGDLRLTGAPAPVNRPIPYGDLRPTGVATNVPVTGVPKPVPTTVSSTSAIVMTSSPAFVLHQSSSDSAQGVFTSCGLYDDIDRMSQNRSEYKSLKAISRPSPAVTTFRPNASFDSSATSDILQVHSTRPLGAAPTAIVPTPVAPNGIAPNTTAPNAVAPDAMATNAAMPNARSHTAVAQAAPQIPMMPSSLTANMKDDANINNTQNRQLESISEQPSFSETNEVISLRLIGPGMQKLEPDGTLPAVRPFTPKFPHPGMDGSLSFSSQTESRVSQQHSSKDKLLDPQTYPGLRRATVTAYNQPMTTSGAHSDVNGKVEMRPHSVDVLHDEAKPEKKMPTRRTTASDSYELLQSNGSNECSDSMPSAYHRTERLLSADFTTLQSIGRKTNMSKGERSRRDARRQSEFDNAGRRPSDTHNGTRHSKSDFPDGLDDVFATKTGLEGLSAAGRRRESYARKQNEKEFNLEMLDSALAGLQASANSPSDDSGPSQEVLQSPQSGKTTPGFYTGQGQPQSTSGTLVRPFANELVSSSATADVPTSLKTSQAPRFVRDSSKYWHKPNIARDEVIDYLKDKPPGSFVIRNSNSFPGAFGLALKVAHLPPNVHSRGGDPKAELVRHFLIEPTLKGVKLKGCSTEPVFGSLAALVYQHSQTPLSLPCKLIIPDSNNLKTLETVTTKSQSTASEVLSQGAACNVLYINSVDMESLTGYEAINKAIAWTFKQSPAPLTTLVHFKVSSQGITLTDTNRRLFFRRHYPVDTVTFAGMDPEDRNWTWTNEETKASVTAKIFGFVARKQGSPTDNACHIFAELDADQPGSAIVEFIMKVMLGRGRSKQDSI